MFYVWWCSTQLKWKMIWYLDSVHQNSWKALYSNSLICSHTLEKIYNQLYISDKMMVHIIKTLIMFDDFPLNQKQKWFDIWIQHIKTVGKHSCDHIHEKQISNQLYSSDKMMVQLTKTHIVLCLMSFHSTKSDSDLIFGFSISKQLENNLFKYSYTHIH